MSVNKVLKEFKIAPIISEVREGADTYIKIKYHGRIYLGFSACHAEDLNFYSVLIGGTIAHYRAMINALKAEIKIQKFKYEEVNHIYLNMMKQDENLKYILYKEENRLKQMREAKKILEEELRDYIKDFNKAKDSVEKNRARINNEN
jgi:hypothetical protein